MCVDHFSEDVNAETALRLSFSACPVLLLLDNVSTS